MTGELALARHVHSAATGCWEPGSERRLGTTLVAGSAPRSVWSWRSSRPAEPAAS